MKYLIANWKSHHNLHSAQAWLQRFLAEAEQHGWLQQELLDKSALKKELKKERPQSSIASLASAPALDLAPALDPDQWQLVLAPPYPLLSLFTQAVEKQAILSAWFKLGVQDLSSHKTGAYTGAVCAQNLQGLAVDYALVGHSERRHYFYEDNQIIAQKFIQARKHQLVPIICLEADNIDAQAQVIEQQLQQVAKQDWGKKIQQAWLQAKSGNSADGSSCNSCPAACNPLTAPSWLVAYEPSEAIGSGSSAAVQQVADVKKQVAQHFPLAPFLYGGSVDENNVGKYLAVTDGVLVGGVSLQAEQFAQLILQALSSRL